MELVSVVVAGKGIVGNYCVNAGRNRDNHRDTDNLSADDALEFQW